MHYYFKYNDDRRLHPLRATVLALEQYKRLDKWEWYLLNTCIRHDNDENEVEQFNMYMEKYRAGLLSFTMENVVEKPKGHQYIKEQ